LPKVSRSSAGNRLVLLRFYKYSYNVDSGEKEIEEEENHE